MRKAAALLNLPKLVNSVSTASRPSCTTAPAAFLISAQLNFLLSSLLTWADRETGGRRSIAWRLLRFNALISVAAVANQAIYLAFERMLPYLLAGAIALVVTAVAKYFIADRWVFPGAGKKQQIRAGGASVHPGVAE